MTINRRKFIFSVNEFYNKLEDSKQIKKADIHAYLLQKELRQTNKPYSIFAIQQQVLNLCIDLLKTEEVLRSEMDRTTRHKINKAIQDNLSIECLSKPSLKDIEEFTEFYISFAKKKKIGGCNEKRLISLMKEGKLVISSIYTQKGEKLASHARIANDGTAIALYSCSARFTNHVISSQLVSRANRYLHWHTMLYFKNLGYHTFNFMGLSFDPSDHAHQNINKFKKGFGGTETIEYQSFIPQNVKGILYTIILKYVWRNSKEVIRKGNMPVSHYLATCKN